MGQKRGTWRTQQSAASLPSASCRIAVHRRRRRRQGDGLDTLGLVLEWRPCCFRTVLPRAILCAVSSSSGVFVTAQFGVFEENCQIRWSQVGETVERHPQCHSIQFHSIQSILIFMHFFNRHYYRAGFSVKSLGMWNRVSGMSSRNWNSWNDTRVVIVGSMGISEWRTFASFQPKIKDKS